MTHAVVIGGGIAGLTAARELREAGVDVVVLESGDRPGGKLRTGRVGDFDLDVGAEAMLALRPEGVELASELGLDVVHPEPAPASLWLDGQLRPIPPTVMGVPTDLDSLRASGVIPGEVVSNPLPVPEGDVSLGEFVAERLGREVVDRLVEPLIGGVYAGRADRLSLRATAPALATLGDDLLVGARNRQATATGAGPMLAGVVGGMGRLATTLAQDLDVRCEHTVRALTREGTSWQIAVDAGDERRSLSADAVVLATPAAAASRLLAEIAPKASFLLAGVDTASMALVTFVLSQADVPSGNGFLVPPTEKTTIKAATFLSNKWRWIADAAGGATILRASIGRAGDSAMLGRSDAELTAIAAEELTRAFGSDGSFGTIEASAVERWGGALPQYEVGHLDLVDAVMADIAGVENLAICGATYGGVGIPAVIANARRAAQVILATR